MHRSEQLLRSTTRPLEWLVVAAAVDGRHLGAHGPQIGGQGPAVMDAVIVQESQVERDRQIKHTEEVHGGQQLLCV